MNPPVSAPAIKVVKSVREQVSPEEWDARVNLAACYRLVAMYGYTEGVANHISCRVPGHHDQFLINPYGMLYEEMNASCLIKVDVDGNTLFNASDYNVNVAGFVIHSAIHMARHDVDCVAHTHTPAGMAVSAMECGLLPLTQTSMRFVHIGYHDFEGISASVSGSCATSANTKRWCCAITVCWWLAEPFPGPLACSTAWNAPARCR
jgi:ribulose-5-phosphate 4-epimerase/fuculose-1-phosphate aldolase